MAKSKDRQLADLKRVRKACSLDQAEAALAVWGFQAGRSKGSVRVWNYKHVTITMHAPHGRGGKNLNPGAVAMVIKKIEEAALLQKQEEEEEETDED